MISIPYGAIKRKKIEQKYDVFEFISIPYGAIKSKKSETALLFAYKFQFLMVRLKANLLSNL